ncbi:MAG: phosphoribosylformylglycinamidine synthase subunit PurQ, partial [Deltaproteobacteria bacterium]|nr:phosphoribosylformylglycinamidine synthase subunit PurQ [Deltaproteobacteria bacterium]
MKPVKAMVLTGYGLNCDYETDFSLKLAGAESHRVHINALITGD